MSKKIIIIDDDKVTLTLLEEVLTKHKFQVLSAHDGAEGYLLIEKEKPDILISDMLIPKLHGLDLCKKIKETPELKQIKVILMTAVYKDPVFMAQAKDSGADYFIEKPIDMKKLISRIKKF
jgi:DNA-binding response OmpR family regulator